MSVTSCNGWSNRETWLANVWLTGDQLSYGFLMEAINLPCPATDKAEWLKSSLELQLDGEIDVPCLWRDLLRHAFSQVEWLEIIKSNSA